MHVLVRVQFINRRQELLSRDATLGYHLANLLLHAAAAILVMLIMRGGLPGGWLAALIFALHPVCVESVAWIAEQKNTLSTVFYLSAALLYLHFDRRGGGCDFSWLWRYSSWRY